MRHLTFTFLLTMLLSMVGANSFAQTFVVDGIKYNVTTENTVEVTSNSPRYSDDIVIPESVSYEGTTYSVTSIGEHAFNGCVSLTSITIGNSVNSIGGSIFFNCVKLSSITVELGNPKYDSRDNCNAIVETSSNTLVAGCKNTTIPNSVTGIGDYAFLAYTDFTSFTIPNSVTSIGEGAFSGFRKLTSIIIPNSVTTIGDHAFSNCSCLTSVTIPNSVTSIGEQTFIACSSLTSVTIGNSVTTIGEQAFGACRCLTSITIPNNVTTIGEQAFYGCSSLTSITVPSSVTSIGEGAFRGCSGLTAMIVATGNFKYDSRNNCNAIINTNSNTLIAGCKNTVIPNSVTTIGDYAFSGCSGLTSVTIPNSVTSIGKWAFSACSGLTSITIPSSVTSIGRDAFDFPIGLTNITSLATVPPSCSGSTFNFDTSNCQLFVPEGSVDAYKVAKGWKDFYNIVGIATGIESVTRHGYKEAINSIYDLNGRQQQGLRHGLNIVRMSDGTVKKTMMK